MPVLRVPAYTPHSCVYVSLMIPVCDYSGSLLMFRGWLVVGVLGSLLVCFLLSWCLVRASFYVQLVCFGVEAGSRYVIPMPVAAQRRAKKIAIQFDIAHGMYAIVAMPNVPAMYAPAAVHGIIGSTTVTESSIVLERFLGSRPSFK